MILFSYVFQQNRSPENLSDLSNSIETKKRKKRQIDNLQKSIYAANETIKKMQERQDKTDQLLLEMSAKMSTIILQTSDKKTTNRGRANIQHTPDTETATPNAERLCSEEKKLASARLVQQQQHLMEVDIADYSAGDVE